jgi:LPS-assembly lipoprotein
MRRAAPLLLALLLAGCGFRLVGDRALPEKLQRVHVDVIAPYRVMEPPIETALRALLLRRGSQVLDRPLAGVTEIRLSQLQTRREILSVGADGKALEFALITRVQMDVRRDGAVLVPATAIEVTRDFSFNAEQVLAKEAEEERLRRYLQTEIAELLLLRLEALLSATPAIVAPAAPGDAPPAAP